MNIKQAILVLLAGIILGGGTSYLFMRPTTPASGVGEAARAAGGTASDGDNAEDAGSSLIGRRAGKDAGTKTSGGIPAADGKGVAAAAGGTSTQFKPSTPAKGNGGAPNAEPGSQGSVPSGGGTGSGGAAITTTIPSGTVGVSDAAAAQVLVDAATGSSGIDQKIDVPFGAKVPAVVLDNAQERPAPQQAALAEILADFSEDVAGITPNSPDATRIWEQARVRADERYRILYGDEAFNALTMQAAIEALQEKDPAAFQTGP